MRGNEEKVNKVCCVFERLMMLPERKYPGEKNGRKRNIK